MIDLAALHVDDDALGPAAVIVIEVEAAVNAGIRTMPPVVGQLGVHRAQRPTHPMTGDAPFPLPADWPSRGALNIHMTVLPTLH